MNASHDAGALAEETRSFIDAHLWNSLKNGDQQLGGVVVAAPPCDKINGLRTDAQGGSDVLGMLDRPLAVRLLGAQRDLYGGIVAGGRGHEG